MPRIILCSLLLMLGLAGCDNSKAQLVGKWKSGEVVWDFSSNGTLTTDGTPGRYSFGDNKRIKIQTGAATFVYQLEIQGDRMTWKDPGGSSLELTKIR